jgi:hypothetical protein
VLAPGANPTIMSYNANIRLAHFESKNIFSAFKKRSSLPTTTKLVL